MKKTMLVASAAFALALTAAQAQTSSPAAGTGAAGAPPAQTTAAQGKVSKADQQFVKEAIEGDLSEVKIGQLAQQKGQSDQVKQFGQTLQQDHGQNLQQAQALAQQLNVQAPNAPNAKQKKMYDSLSKLSGNRFDKQFAKDMVQDHKQDIAKFQKEAKGKGPAAQFAQQTLPTLQKHLQMAQSIENSGAAVGQKAGSK